MKKTALFCTVLLFVILLVLCACQLPALPGLPGSQGTTATPTGGGTTAPPPTTAPVTTKAPVVTTVAPNPLKKINVKSGKLVLQYANNATQELGAPDIPARDGYNGATVVRYSANAVDGVITLTLRDNAAANYALTVLNEETEEITVSIKEENGNLCYATAGAAYKKLASTKAKNAGNGESLLAALASGIGLGKQDKSARGDGVVFTVGTNNDIYIRAKEWMESGKDFLYSGTMHKGLGDYSAGGNWNFGVLNMFTEPASAPNGSTANAVHYKVCVDEFPSFSFPGTYISAIHGAYIVAAMPNTFGFTEEDIGSTWKCTTKFGVEETFVLVQISGGDVWFCPYNETAMQTGDFSRWGYVDPLIASGTAVTHVSGGKHNKNGFTTKQNSVETQFRVATNHVEQHVFLNGTQEIDAAKAGSYEAEFIDVYEKYDLIYLPAMLEYLMDNVGFNSSDSQHDDAIKEAYTTTEITTRFNKNGSYTEFVHVTFHKDVSSFGWILPMSMGFGKGQMNYVPGLTPLAQPTEHTTDAKGNPVSLLFGVDHLADPSAPLPTMFFHMNDATYEKSVMIGLYPYFGDGTDTARRAAIAESNAGSGANILSIYNSTKVYPYIIPPYLSAEAGKEISAITFHAPSVPYDDDFFSVNWFFMEDDIYLSLNTDGAVDKKLALPDYMVGMNASLTEYASGMTIGSSVTSDGLAVRTSGAAYALIKLTPAE